MKGLLRKELYIWAKSKSWALIAAFLFCLFNKFISGYIFVLWLATTTFPRLFADDESSRWNDYSRALPYTAARVVSAKYLFALAETFIFSILITVTITLYVTSYEAFEVTLVEYFPYFSDKWVLLSNMTSLYTVWLIGIAVSMPLNYKLKGVARGIAGIIPLVISSAFCSLFLLYAGLDQYTLKDTIPKIFYNERWFFAACAAAVILAVAVSWIVCIIFADNSKKRTKKLIKPAAILGGLLIALTAFSFTALNVKGYFEEKEKHENYQDDFSVNYETPRKLDLKKREITKDQKNARAEMQELMDSFIFENHLGDNHQNLIDKILGMGYHDTGYNSEEFKSVKDENIYDNVTIRLYLEGETDLISVVDTTVSPGQFWIESATDDELDDLAKQFPIGMSQAELHEKLKTLQVVPTQVSERYFDNERFLYYTLYYEIGDYNNSGSAYYRIHIDVADGVIFDTRNYVQQ